MAEMNIYQRMSAITNEIQRVAKNLNVDAGKSSYKAVGEADVLEAVKPAEAKYGVYSYPVDREIVENGTITSEGTYNGQVKRTERLFMRERVVYRFVNLDKTDEYIDMVSYSDGIDSGDKAPGKAATYADKYALLKAYKITTGDDPDQKASEPMVKKETRTPMVSENQLKFLQKLYDASPENASYIEREAPDKKKLTMSKASAIIEALTKK